MENFDNERPIYIQIVEKIKLEIITEKYKTGEKIPSVRELSVMLKVNPNTVQKALQELENINLIYTERTNGKFVTENKKTIQKIKEEIITEKINIFLTDMKNIGLNISDIIDYLKKGK